MKLLITILSALSITSTVFAADLNCQDSVYKTNVQIKVSGDNLEVLLLKGIVLRDPNSSVYSPYIFMNAPKGTILNLTRSSHCVSGRVCYEGFTEKNSELNIVFENDKMYLWASETMGSDIVGSVSHSSDEREFICR